MPVKTVWPIRGQYTDHMTRILSSDWSILSNISPDASEDCLAHPLGLAHAELEGPVSLKLGRVVIPVKN